MPTLTRKPTWRMTAPELARVVADNKGWVGRSGGWIYDQNGRPIAHGWLGLATFLQRRGFIAVGTGVYWRRMDLAGI